jgi:acetoin utilization deacetylase AcuC-like enzyme
MTQSLTEVIGEQATNALHEAIRVAWQAGYDAALMDHYATANLQEAHYLSVVKDESK